MIRNAYRFFSSAWTRHSIEVCTVGIILSLAISFHQPNVLSLLAAATSSLPTDKTVVFFNPSTTSPLSIGDTVDVDINVHAIVPINVFGATISFPQDSMEVIGISKSKSFLDLWTEETVIREDVGEVHFSGGTIQKGGLSGVATALTITLRAKKSGHVDLTFLNADVLANNGKGDFLENERRSISFEINRPILVLPTSSASEVESIGSTNREDGNVSLLDMSIFTIHLFGPYSIKYDVNRDGVLNLSDLSAFFGRIKNPTR